MTRAGVPGRLELFTVAVSPGDVATLVRHGERTLSAARFGAGEPPRTFRRLNGSRRVAERTGETAAEG